MSENFSIEMSSGIGNLSWALCQAQKEMNFAPKDSSNPFFKSKYADLASVWGVSKEPLTKYGLSVMQFPCGDGEFCGLTTVLSWASLDGEVTGCEWIRCKFLMKPKDNSPQAMGSCLTYMRRYALSAIVGVIADDDDANLAQQSAPKKEVEPIYDYDPYEPYEGLDNQKRFLKEVCEARGIINANMMGKISAAVKTKGYKMNELYKLIPNIFKDISNGTLT